MNSQASVLPPSHLKHRVECRGTSFVSFTYPAHPTVFSSVPCPAPDLLWTLASVASRPEFAPVPSCTRTWSTAASHHSSSVCDHVFTIIHLLPFNHLLFPEFSFHLGNLSLTVNTQGNEKACYAPSSLTGIPCEPSAGTLELSETDLAAECELFCSLSYSWFTP